MDCAADGRDHGNHGADRGGCGQRRHPARPAADGPGAGGEPGRSWAPPAARDDGSPVPAVTLPDDFGHGQRPGLAGSVIGQLPQFVLQVRHCNTS